MAAFTTLCGLCVFVRMPFGLCNIPADQALDASGIGRS